MSCPPAAGNLLTAKRQNVSFLSFSNAAQGMLVPVGIN